ncbi:hypothetical protein [Streptomyces sp. NPDC058812]|uniref:hypothetical protein n=1 Tax=unclassified Streptomyces TaxID=2593676 RepID=UPI0036741722
MTTTPRDLDRLAQTVKRHRMQQYPSRDAAAEAADMTRNTWKRVEEGKNVYESTYIKVEKALGWVVGSCIAIAEGGAPALAAEANGPSAGPSAPAALLTEEEARRAVFEAARAQMPASTPIGALDGFSDELVEILRRAGVVKDGD